VGRGPEPVFDVIVEDSGGHVVWQRLGKAAVPAILQLRVLQPDETLEWHARWRTATAGGYAIVGVLPTAEREPMRTRRLHVTVIDRT